MQKACVTHYTCMHAVISLNHPHADTMIVLLFVSYVHILVLYTIWPENLIMMGLCCNTCVCSAQLMTFASIPLVVCDVPTDL